MPTRSGQVGVGGWHNLAVAVAEAEAEAKIKVGANSEEVK